MFTLEEKLKDIQTKLLVQDDCPNLIFEQNIMLAKQINKLLEF